MDNLKPLHSQLEDLQSNTKNLTKTSISLNSLFAREKTRMKWKDEASTMRAVYHAIVEQFQRLKETEASARLGHSQAKLVLFPMGLVVTAVIAKENRLSAMADYLLKNTADKRPFGLVMVRIGPKGLPDDVGVVSISQLARESYRPQPEIMNKLQDDGYLLFTEETFSLLIDRLIVDVREGKLRLPVSRNKLAEIIGLNKPKPRIRFIASE